MKTKTSHNSKALQGNQAPLTDRFKVKGSLVDFNSLGFYTQPKTKDFPDWVIIPIVIAGFLGCYYAGLIAECLINLQTILN